MFCSKCGAKISDDAVFCNNCGSKREVTSQKNDNTNNVLTMEESAPQNNYTQPANNPHIEKVAKVSSGATAKKKTKVLMPVIVFAIVAAICVFFVLMLASSSGGNSSENGTMVLLYDFSDNVTHIVFNNKLIDDTIQGDVSSNYCESSIGGGVYVLKGNDNTLYIIDHQGVKSVAYDIDEFALSWGGNGLVYADEEGSISFYDRITKDKIRIAKDCAKGENNSYHLCVSPNGKSVTYTDYSDGEYVMYSYSNDEKNRVARNILPLAVADNSDGYFARDTGNGLYYIDKTGEKEKISSSFYGICYFNEGGNEIIFMEEDSSDISKYYYFSAGGEKSKLYDGKSYSYCKVYYPNNTLYRKRTDCSIYIIPSKTLMDGAIYLQESTGVEYSSGYTSNMIYVNKIGEKDTIPCPTLRYFNDDYYFNNGVFVYEGKIYKGGKSEQIGIEGIGNYVVSNSGKGIYYTRYEASTESVNLYYSTIDGHNEVKLYNDIGRSSSLEMKVLDDRYLLFSIGKSLYISDNGGEKKNLSDHYIYIHPDKCASQTNNRTYFKGMAYVSYDKDNHENNVCILSSETNSTQILENISNPEYYSSSVSLANGVASSLRRELDYFLTEADTNGYGISRSSCMMDVEISEDYVWNIKLSNVYAFNSNENISWASEATATATMWKSEAEDATALLAIHMASLFPDIRGACFEVYISDGYCKSLWYTEDTSSVDDVASFSYGKNCDDDGWFYYYNWVSGISGVSSEGYIIGTSPVLS